MLDYIKTGREVFVNLFVRVLFGRLKFFVVAHFQALRHCCDIKDGFSGFEKALPGPSLLGNWVWLLEYRQHYGRDGKRISGALSKRIKSGR